VNLKAQINRIPAPVKTAILIVLAAKILVLFVGYAVTYLNSAPTTPLAVSENMFNRWDSSTYLKIAQNGYSNTGDEANFIVFFPLFPLLIRAFTFDFAYANITALAVSNVCSLIAFLYLYKLAKLEFNDGVAVKAVLFFGVFPTAYFLSVPYTESLFLALAIACIYYARVGKWKFAGLLSFFTALTRISGLLLLPVLLVEYFHQIGLNPKRMRLDVFFTLGAAGGFVVYLFMNSTVAGSPFAFLSIEASHWFNRVDPWSGLTAAYYWATTQPFSSNITIGIAPIASAAFGAAMIGAALWKRLRPSLTFYMILSWALAVSTAWWVSVPRYVLAMFPMFILLGSLIKNKATAIAFAVASAAAMCFFCVLFALGWWAF
jgi:hypothetical protein